MRENGRSVGAGQWRHMAVKTYGRGRGREGGK